MNRYTRQIAVIGSAHQRRIEAARIAVIGAGGLGSSVIPLLAGAGVGRLDIIDHDRIEESNLHRQVIFTEADLGQPKAEIAAFRARRLNAGCRARAELVRIDPANAPDLTRKADVIIDAADSFAVSYALSDLCRRTGQVLISASVIGQSGYAGAFCGGGAHPGPGLRAVFPEPPASAESCASAGVMGPVVAALGAIQAQMAIQAIMGEGLHRLVTLDARGWRLGGFSFAGAKDAPGIPFIAESQIGPGDRVIDLRLETLPEALPQGRIVLACTTGLRAWRAGEMLRRQGHSDLALLAR